MTRWPCFLFGGWVVVATIGGWTVHRRAEPARPCTLRTERRLPFSFRLADGDWSAPEDVATVSGKYTDREYRLHEPFCAHWLDDVPRLNVHPGHHPVLLEVAAARLNAGASVWLAGKGWTIDAPVLTVLCPNKVCNAIVVEVSEEDVAKASAQPPPSVLLHTLP
jgi:hypothetical protein